MDVTASVEAARTEAKQRLDTFARQVADAVETELPRGVNPFLAALGTHVESLAAGATRALERETDRWTRTPEGARIRDRFARDARLALAPVLAYSKGFLDGGAGSPRDLAAALVDTWAEPALSAWFERVTGDFEAAGITGAPPAEKRGSEAKAAPAVKAPADKAAAPKPSAASRPLATPPGATATRAPTAVPAARTAGPEAADRPQPPAPALDLKALLERAAALGIRIRNVPENPSQRYLEKLAEQLEERAKKNAPTPATSSRVDRKATLAAFAHQLQIKVKLMPDRPSDEWLDKMEEKLREVANRKGVPLPSAMRPPPRTRVPTVVPGRALVSAPARPVIPTLPASAIDLDLTDTPPGADRDEAPPTQEAPRSTLLDADTQSDVVPAAIAPAPTPEELAAIEARAERVKGLIAKAAEAELELGRIPTSPTDEWIQKTEARLESAIKGANSGKRAERKKKEAERKARIEMIRSEAERLGVDLGKFPPFPTDDWLARAQLRIQSAMLGPAPEMSALAERGRAARVQDLLGKAAAAGADLGEIPPDPDDEWLEWAEAQLDQAREAGSDAGEVEAGEEDADESALALVSEGFETVTAALVYEEGTVQEQSWLLEADPITVGRGRGNTVHVRDDAGISRQHFTIWTEGGRYFLRDAGSTKGTLVHGERVDGEIELLGDEVIVASETQFAFRLR